jgi:serine/threonine-protein kinase
MTSPAPPVRAGAATPRIPSDGTRFLPGQVLADRYRMVGLLGRGGMGEVYRADDLKLGQPVALKFLPREVEGDPDRLERFLNEVRLSLRVTHPNVCRVFDIGQFEQRHFLSMEYVDGEDLASLLRRIGRLPEDKAVEIARQLCAGLAAAHDEGVLHRDLKPANVMIDGRGRAKITDFGLASATAGVAGREARVGTPQYMAPEQFDGRELTVRTDLYSLGLVLYELFTGRRAYDGRDVLEIATMKSSAPTSPAAHVAGLSPIVERAILRCIQPDPADRPASVTSLVALLPGGDPLAMAVAAGETPSPEMVARAGGRGELRPAIAIACLVAVLAGMGLAWMTESRTQLQNRVPMPKPPEELRALARSALAAAGYADRAPAVASGFIVANQHFELVERTDLSPGRFDNLAAVTPSVVRFWYRESPRALAPDGRVGIPDGWNPILIDSGMARVQLDPSGRLLELAVVPPDLPDRPGPYAEPDWAPMFAAAGLVREEWSPVEPLWTPPTASDARRGWTKDTLRFEAASFRGRPVWFRMIPEYWQPGASGPSFTDRAMQLGWQAIQVIMIVTAALLARRNLRQERSDRRGAFRLAAAFVVLGAGYYAVLPLGGTEQWFDVFTRNLSFQVVGGAIVWLFYLAIEPYVRRWWPGTLVAWSRVLDGQLRDPMVGRHILVGALAGLASALVIKLPLLSARVFGLPGPIPYGPVEALSSNAAWLAALLYSTQAAFIVPFGMLIVVLICRVVFRRPWLAYLVVFMIGSVFLAGRGLDPAMVTMRALLMALSLFVVTRFGLFAIMVVIVFSAAWGAVPHTTDPSSWYFGGSVATVVLFAAIAVYGFVVSLGGQKLFNDAV